MRGNLLVGGNAPAESGFKNHNFLFIFMMCFDSSVFLLNRPWLKTRVMSGISKKANQSRRLSENVVPSL